MDISQLLSILERKQLWFSRVDKLDDPYEGSLTKPRRDVRDQQVKALWDVSREEEGWTPIEKEKETLIQEQIEKNKHRREWVFVNCWHHNQKESAAMWDLYAKSDDAIALKTTFQRLIRALHDNEEEISLSKVRYIDFDKEDMVRGDSTLKFLYKRKSFEHEKEVRALFWDVPDLDEENNQPPGQYIDVNLDPLIEEIRVAPSAPGWFADTVERTLATYGLEENVVRQSDLAEEPLF